MQYGDGTTVRTGDIVMGVHRMPLGSARLVAANNPAGE